MSDVSNMSVLPPYAGLPLLGKKHTTKVHSLWFDYRDKVKFTKKQEKIKKVLEGEKSLAELHSLLLPVFENGMHTVPEKKNTLTLYMLLVNKQEGGVNFSDK